MYLLWYVLSTQGSNIYVSIMIVLSFSNQAKEVLIKMNNTFYLSSFKINTLNKICHYIHADKIAKSA